MRKSTIKIFTIALLLMAGTAGRSQNITETIGGTGTSGSYGNGIGGYLTQISNPHGVCVDAANNVYYTDQGNGLVRKIAASNGVITTIAGGGASTADGVPATSEAITPYFVCTDAAGDVYFTTGNQIKTVNAATGIITTYAGTGAAGLSGDGGAATAATLNSPTDLCIDAANNIYVLDSGNNCVRKITAATGVISRIAGDGGVGYTGDGGPATAATMYWPTSICINSTGDVYVSDQCHSYTMEDEGMFLRKITAATGIITTVAGTDTYLGSNIFGMPLLETYLGHITGMCCDDSGNIYCNEISCSGRELDVHSDSSYAVSGNFEIESYSADGISSLLSYMNFPFAACMDAAGNIYIADGLNNRIRKILPLTHMPTFAFRNGQTIYPCSGATEPINNFLVTALLDASEPVTWSVIGAPAHGTLGGFPYTMLSIGTDSINTPAGLTYSSAAGYAGTDMFTIMVTNGTTSDTMNIYVQAGSTSPIAIISPVNICTGASQPIVTTITGGTFALTNTDASHSGANVYGEVSGVDTFIYSIPGMCTAMAAFTVNPSPVLSTIAGTHSICLAATATLSDTATGGIWTSGTTTIAAIDSITGIITPLTSGIDNFVYTKSNAYCTSTATWSVTVGTPTAPIAGTTDNVCISSTVAFSESISGGVWSMTNSNAGMSTVGSDVSVWGVTPGADTLVYSVTNGCGTATDTARLTVYPIPTLGSVYAPEIICVGATAVFTATDSAGTWLCMHGDLTLDATAAYTGTFTGAAAGTDSIVYTITNSGGCSARDTIGIVVDPLPVAGVITGSGSVYAGGSTMLTDTMYGGTWLTTNSTITTVSGSGSVYGVAVGVDSAIYIVTNSCGSDTAYFSMRVSDSTTGIGSVANNSADNISIIPNPAGEHFTISVVSPLNEAITISIMNMAGEKVSEFKAATNQPVDGMLNAPSGVYLLTATGGHLKLSSKIVKE